MSVVIIGGNEGMVCQYEGICKNYGCKKCNTANEGAVYIFAVPENEVLYYDSDRAKMFYRFFLFKISCKGVRFSDALV